MLNEETSKKVVQIWDQYVAANKPVLDTRGNVIIDIDKERPRAIADIKEIIANFLKGEINISEFKTLLDSYNKRNNLWGFTATKGQMFFNQLVKTNEQDLPKLTAIVKESISEPRDIKDALDKIEKLEKFTSAIFDKGKDKRKVPNPGSVGYFLSYFWQIHNYLKWPIIYTSLTTAFTELGIWKELATQKDIYAYFFSLNEEIKAILKSHSKRETSNWDAEHAFWNYAGNPHSILKKSVREPTTLTEVIAKETMTAEFTLKANFELGDYLIPKVAKLIELGTRLIKLRLRREVNLRSW